MNRLLLSACILIAGSGCSYRHKPTDASIFFSAIRQGQNETVRRHLSAGINPDLVEFSRMSALTVATTSCQPEITRLLLSYGASSRARDHEGYPPLTIAAAAGCAAAIDLIISTGVDLNELDSEGHTALWAAVKFNHYECADLLLKKGADANAGIYPPLRIVEQNYGDNPLQDLLLSYGAK